MPRKKPQRLPVDLNAVRETRILLNKFPGEQAAIEALQRHAHVHGYGAEFATIAARLAGDPQKAMDTLRQRR